MKLQPTHYGEPITRDRAAALIRSHRRDVSTDPSWYSLYTDKLPSGAKTIFLGEAYENGSFIRLSY